MLQFLGPRGKVVTAAVAGLAVAGAAYAALEGDWSAAVSLVLLGYLCGLAGAAWGVTQTTWRTTSEVAGRQRRTARSQRVQLKQIEQRVSRAQQQLTQVRRAQHSAAGPTAPVGSIERKYAGVLGQPETAPNSSLLSYLEILTRDATTRRADDAILRQAVSELRETVAMQQREIESLHRRAGELDPAESADSADSVDSADARR